MSLDPILQLLLQLNGLLGSEVPGVHLLMEQVFGHVHAHQNVGEVDDF